MNLLTWKWLLYSSTLHIKKLFPEQISNNEPLNSSSKFKSFICVWTIYIWRFLSVRPRAFHTLSTHSTPTQPFRHTIAFDRHGASVSFGTPWVLVKLSRTFWKKCNMMSHILLRVWMGIVIKSPHAMGSVPGVAPLESDRTLGKPQDPGVRTSAGTAGPTFLLSLWLSGRKVNGLAVHMVPSWCTALSSGQSSRANVDHGKPYTGEKVVSEAQGYPGLVQKYKVSYSMV